MKVSRFGSLEEARQHYLTAVDTLAGEIRIRHITDVPGQGATYEFKRQDAEAFMAAGEPEDPASFPWIAAEADALEDTMSMAAAEIIRNRDTWQQGGVAIEGARMKGKYRIKKATTTREAYDAYNDAVAIMEQISQQIALT